MQLPGQPAGLGIIDMPLLAMLRSGVARLLAAVALVATTGGLAHAQGYDFSQFLSGGGGGQDPQKRQLAQSMGAYICLRITPGQEPNTVSFTILSRIPQPNSRIGSIVIDVGRHSDLIRAVKVAFVSPGVTASVIPAQLHPFLRGLSPDFWIQVPQKGHLNPEGLAPGRLVSIAATLGPGKSINDVFNALHEGLSPASGSAGLRVGVVVLYLLGGPPPGVGTIQDDGGFVTARPSSACR